MYRGGKLSLMAANMKHVSRTDMAAHAGEGCWPSRQLTWSTCRGGMLALKAANLEHMQGRDVGPQGS